MRHLGSAKRYGCIWVPLCCMGSAACFGPDWGNLRHCSSGISSLSFALNAATVGFDLLWFHLFRLYAGYPLLHCSRQWKADCRCLCFFSNESCQALAYEKLKFSLEKVEDVLVFILTNVSCKENPCCFWLSVVLQQQLPVLGWSRLGRAAPPLPAVHSPSGERKG